MSCARRLVPVGSGRMPVQWPLTAGVAPSRACSIILSATAGLSLASIAVICAAIAAV